jgi:hypothetical protein
VCLSNLPGEGALESRRRGEVETREWVGRRLRWRTGRSGALDEQPGAAQAWRAHAEDQPGAATACRTNQAGVGTCV